uniref:Hypothetical chloroplast RF66 n=1 Tax=Verdigellas peltata TaxID=542676 RepID=A0A161KBX0_9VIRI|nr:hypothetical chloroplast RF66 [Verdigellas peltata]CZF96711.1 hypothetical chloroplast RF66 [Verdigellas peltata]
MILFDFDFTVFLALTLLIFSIYYYFICQKKYVLQDSDVFFSCLILLNGGILLFQGWRLDPLLLFTQIISTIMIISFANENISLRNQIKKISDKKLNNKNIESNFYKFKNQEIRKKNFKYKIKIPK